MKKIRSKKGASVLIAVLIMSAALVLISFTSIILSVGDIDISVSYSKGGEALSVAEGCVEESLRRIRLNTLYGIGAGTIPLTTTNGSCTIQVIDTGGGTRTITSIGTVGSSSRHITVELSLTGNVISIISWKET